MKNPFGIMIMIMLNLGFHVIQSNGAMTALYLKSLLRLPSLQATVLSLSANILITGLLAFLVWSESMRPSWLLGAACIISGVAVINHAAGGTQQRPRPGADAGVGVTPNKED